jgi:spore germination protein YaaH
MPIVRNFAPQPMLGDPAAIDRFVDAAAELTVRESFDGLVVDFEHLKAASRRPLVDMATALYLKMRARGKTLCIAVAPKAWEGEYDYAALARQCDLLYVMTYDYAGPWSPAVGPTSPIHGPTRTHDIARDLDELAALDVPAHRTLLGVPFYGLDFTLKPGDAVDEHQHIETLYLNQIDNLRAAHDAKPRFDAQMQAASFIYHDGDGLAHVVWYDDAQSMAAKLDVVRQRGLGGIGAWSLRYDDLSVAGALWPLLPRRAPGVSASR